ncbi:unnamed protein product [Protopolystoma xenopodis]|uniref:Uncharacterized protein n=1 Tax=Protopolystoma xenopodis TaxID=117903 RepID=A0A3S5BGP5_9PLAT|nr:unnamed protein product [Protopolystoma xenopodis]
MPAQRRFIPTHPLTPPLLHPHPDHLLLTVVTRPCRIGSFCSSECETWSRLGRGESEARRLVGTSRRSLIGRALDARQDARPH